MGWSNVISQNWEREGDGREVEKLQPIQELWSGYGQIARVSFVDGSTVVCKAIDPSGGEDHPRGWTGDLSHQRKLRSYQVESSWYEREHIPSECRWPSCLGQTVDGNVRLIWMEDMDFQGYDLRKGILKKKDLETVLRWLASFHGYTYNSKTEKLWKRGTYWHLGTRPDELKALEDLELKSAAHDLDRILEDCSHRCLVHGDAKVANFCFHREKDDVAAVDFQYIGGGIGMQDLAYFIGSCCEEDKLQGLEDWILDRYFFHFGRSLKKFHPQVDVSEVENCWRPLYDVAWTDFHRFLKGWSPGHWKINTYSERVKARCLKRLAYGS